MIQAVLYGSKEVERFARDRFSSLLQGESVHPDIVKGVMQTGALYGDENVLKWFAEKIAKTDSEQERMFVLTALGSFKSKTMIEKAQHFTLSKVPDRNKFVTISFLAANPYALTHMWTWYLSHLEDLEAFHPIHYERVIGAIVPISCIGREDEAKAFFEDYMSKKETAKEAIKLSLEKLEINGRMRRLQSTS
jgi:hypothetical protein